MAAIFCDSSAVVKRYMNETGSAWVTAVLSARRNRIYLARITGVEVVSAIVRRGRGGILPAGQVPPLLAQFHADFASQYRLIQITPRLITDAMGLAEAHALRGYDAVQLATALTVHAHRSGRGTPPLTFVSADAALNAVAQQCGLAVDDPNAHP